MDLKIRKIITLIVNMIQFLFKKQNYLLLRNTLKG